jgi:NAD-dependent protein deacetylase/lipoamidase
MSSPKPHLVVLSGAGISAESGLRTFRDGDGLWEEFRLEDVATPEAWQADPRLVLRFYNQRRRQVVQAEPNAGHLALAELESQYRVSVITQNIDDLHERAGSTRVLHLHGEILQARSSLDPQLLYPTGGADIEWGQLCTKGSQLRPHVVWFGEDVPAMPKAEQITQTADLFLVVGTSLAVYPAANLAHSVPSKAAMWVIDPQAPELKHPNLQTWQLPATVGLPKLVKQLFLR